MKRVLICQRILTHYRLPFYEGLHAALAARGVEFALVHGQPEAAEAAKKDTQVLPWATTIHNRYLPIGRLCLQPCLDLVMEADLVIVEQASRLLVNYPLLALQALGVRRVAFWGHGRNFQSGGSGFSEWLKRRYSLLPHWWFAYNDLSAGLIRGLGYPATRITSVDNAVDTRQLAVQLAAVRPEDALAAATALGLRGSRVGIYVGGMYPEKRLPFLLAACRRVKELVPDFEMLFIGGGPDAHLAAAAARETDFIRFLGPVFGADKARLLKLAKLYLMPGLVGLGILDSFAAGIPVATTTYPFHSPEISYLEKGVNGVVTSPYDDVEAYAQAVARLLADDAARETMAAACRQAARLYTIENMVERFVDGVLRALS